MNYLYLLSAVVLNSGANIAVKLHANRNLSLSKISVKTLVSQYWIFFLAIGFFGISLILYSQALRSLKLSVAYQFMAAASFLLVNLLSFLFLGDKITLMQLSGYLLLIIGIILVAV